MAWPGCGTPGRSAACVSGGAGRVVEVVLVDNARRMAGQIDPPLAGSVVLRHSDGATSTAPVNERGQFFFDTLRRGDHQLAERARRPRSR